MPPCPAVRGELGLEARASRGSQPPAQLAILEQRRQGGRERRRGRRGRDERPGQPSSTSSPIPPTSVATTGTEHAIASMTAVGSASERDGCSEHVRRVEHAMTSGR